VQEQTGKLIDSYSYDGLGQLIQKKRSIEGKAYSITYRWDNFGRQRSVAYSNGFSVYYSYDSGGQVKAVTGFVGGKLVQYVKTVHYDQYGSRTRVEYGNGVVTTYTYDEAMHRLIQLQTKQGDSSYQNTQYTYDKVGNILTRTENGVVMSDSNPKTITHCYSYDKLYRLTQAQGSITEEGNTVHSYTNTFTYSAIGNIMSKLQTVKVKGEQDPNLSYNYTYTYASTKPHAVTNINDNMTYRYDANGNMTALYDTAKNYNRILQWDEENRLIKTVDTTSGNSVTTSYTYDTKGMRIIKDGPYGKTLYIDTGYVETNEAMVSNHVFMGNTRVASIVKHKDEPQPATYYYASDHLGSSSVLTNDTGSYYERLEYLPYGEVWVEDAAINSNYRTPYKFTGKELDKETGLYYFGARYYDARMSRWISTDKYLERYLPIKGNVELDNLPGMGGIYNSINLDLYCYVRGNPILYLDPDGHLLKEFGEWLNKAGADANKAISTSRPVRSLHNAGKYMNENPKDAMLIAGGIAAGATFIPIGMALAPEAMAAVAKIAAKQTVKQGIKKAAVSGAIQAVANVSSNVCVNHDKSVEGNVTTGLVGFGVGSVSSLAGTWGFFEKSAATFIAGAFGDYANQKISGNQIDYSKVALSGIMNMVGSHITGPAIQSARELRLGESAAVQSGFTIPATWGIDALYKQP
jgi:RHS repeat-associated protein